MLSGKNVTLDGMSIVSPDFQRLSSTGQSPQRSNTVSAVPSQPNQVTSQQSLGSFSFTLNNEEHRETDEDREVVLNQYLQDTKLLLVLNSWTVLIAGLEELPYNPYPTLVWYARRHAERFHMFKEEEDAVLQKIDDTVYKVGVHVSRTHDDPPWWGLHYILRAVNAKSLEQFNWLIKHSVFDVPESDENEYAIHKPVVVLVGPCVFAGSFYPRISTVQLRLEYGISGPKLDGASKTFAKLVLHGIKRMETDDTYILLELFVPQVSGHSWYDTRWTYKSITESEEEFLSLVQLAAKGQQFIIAECLFMLTPNSGRYKRGEIQFNLNFMRIEPDRTVNESSLPYRSAYEGVFESHASFINYLAWFEIVHRPEHTPEFRKTTASTSKRSGGLFPKSKKQSAHPSANPSINMAQSSTRTELRGFVSGSSDSTVYPDDGPYAPNIQETLRKFFSFKISSLPREENLFSMLHYIILKLSLHRDNEEAYNGLFEAARLLQSTLYHVHSLMDENTVIQGLVQWFLHTESDDTYVVENFYIEYCEHLKDLLCNEMQERSSEFMVAGRTLLDRLDTMTNTASSRSKEFVTLPITSQVIKELQTINRYCTTIMLGLVDDALNFCPTLRHDFPPINTAGHSLRTSYKFRHGVEVSSILSQGSMYMNREQAKKTIPAPASIANQATILKYFVDVKLDQTFEECLGHVLIGSTLPPNPYPRLVTHLRTAAVSMELFGEKEEKLVPRLLPGSAQIVETKNYIYSCPGSDAYGLISAVSALDSKHYNALVAKLGVVHNKVSSRVTDAGIKATVGLAITGFSPLYGRMMPYLHQIELEEHYFLQGPINARMDVINYFTKLVYDHLVGFAEESSILFVGVFLGDGNVRRSLLDIVPAQKKPSFMSQLLTNVKNEKPVYMKAYIQMDWRLVLVKKSFLLHYIQGQFQGYHRFYKPSPSSYYQNVFSSQAAASLFARACGPQDRSDPCQGETLRTSLVHVNHFVESAKHDGDLLSVYRWLLVKSLMSQSTLYVAEAWYMFHSAAAQLEYLMTLNKTLQNLVYEELSRTFVPAKDNSDNTESLLDMTILSEMVLAYCQKLDHVLQRGTCMTPSGLLNLLHDKLRLVTQLDRTSDTLQLKVTEQTPVILQEINELLQPLLDACAHDIHRTCPQSQHALRSITEEIHGR